MTPTQQTCVAVADQLRRSVVGVLWRIGLAMVGVGLLVMLAIPKIDGRWFAMPLTWAVASLASWLLTARKKYRQAAWTLVVLHGVSILLPSILFSVGAGQDGAYSMALRGLPLAYLLLIPLSVMLLPAWSALILVIMQGGSIYLPLAFGQRVEAIHQVALVLSIIGAGIVWAALRAFYRVIDSADRTARDARQQAHDLRQERDEIISRLRARDEAIEQLGRANAALSEQTSQFAVLASISRLVTSKIDLDELLSEVLDVLYEQLNVSVALFLTSEERDWAVLSVARCPGSRSWLESGFRMRINEQTAIGKCVLAQSPRFVLDAQIQAPILEHLLSDTCCEMAIPLIARKEIVGVLDVQSNQPDAFDEQDIGGWEAIADQVAGAIANLESFAQTREALQELARLQQRYVREAWDRFTPELEAAGYRYVQGTVEPLPHRPLPEVLQAQSAARTLVDRERRVIAPISFRGQVIGALGLQDPDETRQWTAEDINLIESVARQMSVIMDNARLVKETQESLNEITELNRRYVRDAWEEYLPLRQRTEFLFAQPGVPADHPLPEELDDVLQANEALAATRSDNGDAESILITPISIRDQIVGALGLEDEQVAHEWDEDELELVDAVAAQMSWAIENARLFEETEHRAHELEVTARQLRETDQFRAQFLANMSHELRTPLNSIIGFSRVILKGIDGPLTELQQTDLEAIYSNGQHLLTMINEILDMSKIEAGKMELVIENVDLNVLIRGVISTSTALIKDKPIELRTDIQQDLPAVRADATRIRQVITNLMSNAAKFTEEGAITFSVWTEEELVYISVEDTGEGIPEEKVPLVFEAFRQVDGSSTRRAEGTGLGLPISRQFVEMHGGRIWLESEYGVGTKFTFCIPIEGPVEDVPELQEFEIDEEKRLILVVERDESELDLYRTVLDPGEYQLVGLYDTRSVIRWTRYLRPWAILIEVDQEGDSGWDALEALKSMRATRDYPVIACTGIDEGGRAISMGAVAHIPKPIQRDELVQVLERLQRSKS